MLESWTVCFLSLESVLVCRADPIDELSHGTQLPQTADIALTLYQLSRSPSVSPEHKDLPPLVYSVRERRRMNKCAFDLERERRRETGQYHRKTVST